MAASLEKVQSEPRGPENRILIAASDAESTDNNILERGAQVLRSSLSRLQQTEGPFVVETIATLDRRQFSSFLAEFKPGIVVFSARGSTQRYIRMLDARGWIRQISGATLSGLFIGAESKISLLLLLNCKLFREANYVADFSRYLVSVKSKWSTHELPLDIEENVLTTLAGQSASPDAYASMVKRITRGAEQADLEISIFGPDSPLVAQEFRTDVFRTWASIEARRGLQRGAAPERPVPDHTEDGLALRVESPGPRIYRVWFGTNRTCSIANGKPHFGVERDDKISYGYCDVSIPKYHTIGSVGESWWQRFPKFWRNNRLKVTGIVEMQRQPYYETLQELFDALSSDERVLLLFIHGYNVSFEEAAIRAAQMGFDLSIPGATAFFSWPSKSTITGYIADGATIEASEKHIATFIEEVCKESGAEVVHIIAHSMANRGLLRSVCSLTERIRLRVRQKISQIILAAPDVDSQLFKDLASIYDHLSKRTTMYVSGKDLALSSSGILHDYARAGYTPPVTVVRGMDTIEVSNIDLTFLGHGYIAEARSVLGDMYRLMASNDPPNKRFGLEAAKTPADEDYWIIQA